MSGNELLERNKRYREFYGVRFMDMMDVVTDGSGLVQVYTPADRFIFANGKHLTTVGARFFAERIEWGRWLESGDMKRGVLYDN